MKLELEKLEPQVVMGLKDGKGEALLQPYDDGVVRTLMITLKPGSYIGGHVHEGNSEVMYIISGRGVMKYDEEEQILLPGDVHYCPEGHFHSLANGGSEDLVLLAVLPKAAAKA